MSSSHAENESNSNYIQHSVDESLPVSLSIFPTSFRNVNYPSENWWTFAKGVSSNISIHHESKSKILANQASSNVNIKIHPKRGRRIPSFGIKMEYDCVIPLISTYIYRYYGFGWKRSSKKAAPPTVTGCYS